MTEIDSKAVIAAMIGVLRAVGCDCKPDEMDLLAHLTNAEARMTAMTVLASHEPSCSLVETMKGLKGASVADDGLPV